MIRVTPWTQQMDYQLPRLFSGAIELYNLKTPYFEGAVASRGEVACRRGWCFVMIGFRNQYIP